MSEGHRVRLLRGFDDPRLPPEAWEGLLDRSPVASVFMTWHWQSAWWQVFGRGRLLLFAVVDTGGMRALAPLFADGGMVFFVGSGGSDYLDFLGDFAQPQVLAEVLDAARRAAEGFVGFRFYHVPDGSPTPARLGAAARLLGLRAYDEGRLPAPVVELDADPGAARPAADHRSLRRHEQALGRVGSLAVHHASCGGAILPELEGFFAQHVARWEGTPHPSLFHDRRWREFYRRVCLVAGEAGWLRFTRLDCGGRPAAYHFGFHYRGSYLWYKPCFARTLTRCSPGEVLLRHLFLAASREGASRFDFGIGDEPFKQRFATAHPGVTTYGLYAEAAGA
ncbi:MAG: GNAT family N-acetyltransferase [Candidatus Latescibacterota bacterium]